MHILLHCWFYMSRKTKTKHLWKINKPKPQRAVLQSVARSFVKMFSCTNNCTILQRYNAEGFLNHRDNLHRRWSYFQHSNITGMKRSSSPSQTPPSLVSQQPSIDPQKLHHKGAVLQDVCPLAGTAHSTQGKAALTPTGWWWGHFSWEHMGEEGQWSATGVRAESRHTELTSTQISQTPSFSENIWMRKYFWNMRSNKSLIFLKRHYIQQRKQYLHHYDGLII